MPEPQDLVRPLDEHNLRLLANVRPGSWVNPEPAERYHLVVIGAGTAGLVSAAGAAALGARVALVERHLLGGDCLNVGCVPSKAVLRAARGWQEARAAAASFGAPAASGAGDFGAAMARMRRVRAGLSQHDSAERFRGLGVDVFLGEGRFVAGDAVEVDGRRLRFRRAIVATGARAAAPPIPGLAEAGYLTNETLFDLEALPRRLAVIGAGPIGCEMAQAFARFGSEVWLIEVLHGVLPIEERDAAGIVERRLAEEGVRLLCCGKGTAASSLADGRRRVTLESHEQGYDLVVDEILVSVGRRPNLEGLGLEAAGIAYDKTGVLVDDRLRTSNRRVYAVGDIASKYKFTHAADALARIAIQNALFRGRKKASDLVVPWCTYTSPEVAHVGLYPKEAEERGMAVESHEVKLANVDRAVLDGEDEGFLRVTTEQGKDRILGATCVAERAGDLIGEVTLAMTHGVGLAAISATIHPYPTQAEVVKKTGEAYRRTRLTPAAKRLLGLLLRLLR
jgi:pyruvate/2-oxoglutarate dehydrogenase complex dihydrolipoamide dehydrogenase (E3) component